MSLATAALYSPSRKQKALRRLDECSLQVDSALEGKTASETTKRVYTTQDHDNRTYVRNPECWAYGFNLTPVSPWNSREGYARAGALVSPRHIICAHHFALLAGNLIRFVTKDNVMVERTIVACTPADENAPQLFDDAQLCVLDADVPAGIGFCRVMSMAMATYNATRTVMGEPNQPYVGGVFIEQEEKIVTWDWWGEAFNITASRWDLPKPGTKRYEFHEGVMGYDSGSPWCIVSGGELVLVSVATSIGGGPSLAFFFNQLNAAMISLGNNPSGYQLTPF